MAKVISGWTLSLDLFVDPQALSSDAALLSLCLQTLRGAWAALDGRRLYQMMQF